VVRTPPDGRRRPGVAALYGRVRGIVESARAGAARSVNTAQVAANWLVGREIVEEEQQGSRRAGYAERLIAQLADRLTDEYGSGFSAQNLAYMKQFYLTYPELAGGSPIFHALRGKSETGFSEHLSTNIFHAVRGKFKARKNGEIAAGNPILYAVRRECSWRPGILHPALSWTHYRTLLKVELAAARAFYEIEAVRRAWSARELERQIDSFFFERAAKSRDKRGVRKLSGEGLSVSQPAEIFKDPTLIEFLGLPQSPRLTETELERTLIDNLQAFLLELGSGFAFVGRQQRITLDGDHFYIDLVFYHTVLKCYVLVDLKVGKLTHNDLGQIQFYVNYFDRERRTEGDNPTLGLILCSDKNEAVVRYTLGEQQKRKIFASRYQLYLPSEKQLQAEIRREVRRLGPASRNSTGGAA
jgi:predicted nuclease of restriction endonuclease-like (RecB) superfamily